MPSPKDSAPEPSTVLSIDVGSQSVRAGIFRTSGTCLHCWQREWGQVSEQEQDPQALFAFTRSCIENVQLSEQVRADAIVGPGASIVCYRRSDGLPLSPVISWQDCRGAQFLSELSLTDEQVHTLTGLPLSCLYGAIKLRWCLEQNPQVHYAQQVRDLVTGPLMSFLLHHLCRERPTVVDSGNTSRTQLWNLQEQQWDESLTRAFEIPGSVLPAGLRTCTHFGTLDIGGSEIPVLHANRDHQAYR